MKTLTLFAAAAFLAFSGCGSNKQDGGLSGPGVDQAGTAPDTNPEGVPYPTTNIGTLPRNAGAKGNTIQNFKFLGYPNADPSQGLQPISLAQFYDPSGAKYR